MNKKELDMLDAVALTILGGLYSQPDPEDSMTSAWASEKAYNASVDFMAARERVHETYGLKTS